MATWKEVENAYGKERADKMKTCPLLQGITVTILPNGDLDIPQYDIDIAYRWSRGEHIFDSEVD